MTLETFKYEFDEKLESFRSSSYYSIRDLSHKKERKSVVLEYVNDGSEMSFLCGSFFSIGIYYSNPVDDKYQKFIVLLQKLESYVFTLEQDAIAKYIERFNKIFISIPPTEESHPYRDEIEELLNRVDDVVERLKRLGSPSSGLSQAGPRISNDLEWKGTNYELCELIQALFLSGKIKKEGLNIEIDDLLMLFSSIFKEKKFPKKDFNDHLKKGYDTNMRHFDRRFFMKDLLEKIDKDERNKG